MRTGRGLAAMLAIAASLGIGAGPAGAATTQIGAVNETAAGLPPDPITAAGGIGFYAVQVGEATGTYAVPAGYGVITAWRHSAGTTPGDITFKVYRPTGSPGEFLVFAADTQPITPGTVHTFAVRIPVMPGDRIGISTTTAEVGYLCQGDLGVCANPAEEANRAGVFDLDEPDPPVGSRATLDGAPFQGLRLDVSARVETDADGDGFGDDTQDRCPTSATSQAPCPRTPFYALPETPLPPFPGCPGSATNLIRGTAAANTLTGTVRGDRILAGTGDDRVVALAGDDCVDLGPGQDRGQGGPGADLLLGGVGNDVLSGGSGNDRMQGTEGNDRLSGSSGRDRMNGGAGRDAISGDSSADRIAGDQGNDRVNGNSGSDLIKGNSGADRLTGGTGADRISGGTGNDRISARDRRRDRISCGGGRDTVTADRIDRVARDCERVR